MRNLKFKDAFAVSRILKKMHIRPDVQDGMTQEQLGADLVFKFVENIGEAEEEVLEFLADLKGIKPDELAKMDFEEAAKMIEDFKNIKGLQSFFQQVGKLMK
ncbi:hypothetical protein M3204_13915 [Mesobacillus subterraneus]|uniref:hypothetical protein n=1 Tax=Mesobacillus subterraneus TaxID=285983 RepID=UPI00203F73F9|nr:hypothetical protein [Mesobacillus subterraneus]MCM3665509.1 hypothetical protein [Mesobacillus subterraneus]MCM3686068.1 hypothetical protein [Mesobacillus subterraneus]